MIAHKKKRTMAIAVVVSLVLHGTLALSAWLLFSKPAEKIKSDRLLIELFGMVSNRQKEASAPAAAATTPTPPQKTAQTEEKKTQQRRIVREVKTSMADSPVQTAQREDQTAPAAKPSDSAKASELQKQQTLNVLNKDMEELKKYQAKITRKIKSNLVYPADARKRGYEGMAVVRFTVTESGMIQPGSLVVARSSGYAVLDSNALKSARDSEPFERPPRTMPIEIDLGFAG